MSSDARMLGCSDPRMLRILRVMSDQSRFKFDFALLRTEVGLGIVVASQPIRDNTISDAWMVECEDAEVNPIPGSWKMQGR